MPSPLKRYQQKLEQHGFVSDSKQREAIVQLDKLYWLLQEPRPFLGRRKEPIKGLYLWGDVGRGKTFLMDLFYESLPGESKRRLHFHRFMARIHRDLNAESGHADPLRRIAKQLAKECNVLCFDEFFVSDIGDAMILATLMQALFEEGVSLVCTSNIVPDELYKDGLQRVRFLPAIELVKKHTDIVNVDGGVDYRLRTLEQAQLFHYPLGEGADLSMRESYDRLALEAANHALDLNVNGRKLRALEHADDVVWFDFKELCDGPRSQNDYIELAREFHAILISNVPILGNDKSDQARRFINMIDEFYDRSVKVIIAAEAPITELYKGGRLTFEFERTESRLLEMQSQEYLQTPHKP